MRKSEKLKKLLSILMCVCMLVQYVPTVALAAETDGLCAHHTVHTAECGYIPAAAEVVCTHEHTEGCSEQVTNCLHAAHDESCGGLEDAAACPHVCSADSGCVITVLTCGHVNDGSCCYVASVAETPCSYSVDGCLDCQAELNPAADESETEAVASWISGDTTTYITDLNGYTLTSDSSGTLKLLQDVTLTGSNQLTIRTTATFDLNGHTLKSESKTPVDVRGSGVVVTICDSASGGKLSGTPYGCSQGNGTTVIVNSGVLEGISASFYYNSGITSSVNLQNNSNPANYTILLSAYEDDNGHSAQTLYNWIKLPVGYALFCNGTKVTLSDTLTNGATLTIGSCTEHIWTNGVCVCGYAHSDHSSTGDNVATCTQNAKCDICGASYGELADHTFDKEQADGKCTVCGSDCSHGNVSDFRLCNACGFQFPLRSVDDEATHSYYFTDLGTAVIYGDTYVELLADITVSTAVEVPSGVTLSCVSFDITFTDTGSLTNNGTVVLKSSYTYSTIPTQITGGTVRIGNTSYTWDSESGKYVCADGSHTGGTATCKDQAICEVCGTSYGELAAHTPDANGKCILTDCGYQYAARIGDTFYGTIHAAFRAAEENEECILTLLDDITLTSSNSNASYVNKGTFTLDLNGKTLSSDKRTLEVMGNANLTIRDSVGGGKIVSTGGSAIYLSGGNLTVESGSFAGTLDGLFVNGTSEIVTATIKGGTFSGGRAMITVFGTYCMIDLTKIDPAGFTLKNNGRGTFTPTLTEDYGMVGSDGKLLESLSAEQSATIHKHEYKYTDLGNGNHLQACSCGLSVGTEEAHTLTYALNEAKDTITATCSANCGHTGTAAISATGKTYDGTAVEITVSRTGFLANTDISVTLTKDGKGFTGEPVDAGVYTASITFGSQTASVEFTIAPKELTAADVTITLSPDSFLYDGSEKLPTVTIKLGDKTLDGGTYADGYTPDNTTCDYRLGLPLERVKPGRWAITVLFMNNYSGEAVVHYTITVPEAILSPAAPNGENGWYKNASLLAPNGYTVSATKDGSFGNSMDLSDGTYESITYWLTYADNAICEPVSLTLTGDIKVDTTVPTVSGTAESITDSAASIHVTAEDMLSGVASATLTCADSSVTIGELTNSAFPISGMQPNTTYTFTLTVTDKAGNEAVATVEVTTDKANSSVTAAPTAKELSYNGNEQALVTAGTAQGGEIQYSLDNQNWSADIPTGTRAGDYTVWYYVLGDANHADSAKASVQVTIAKKELTPVLSGSVSKTYDGTTDVPAGHGLAITLEGIISADVLSITRDYAYASANAGETTVIASNITLSGDDAGNYKLTTNTASAEVGTIEKQKITIPTMRWEVPENAVYNGTEYTATLKGELPDGVVVTLSGNKATDAGDYTAKAAFSLAEGYDTNYEIENGDAVTAQWSIGKAVPVADDFVLSLPSDLIYDGQVKKITVAPADGVVGMGAITVICYTPGADQENSEDPRGVNDYIVSFNVEDGDNYTGATNLTAGRFAITPAKLTITANDKSAPIGSRTPTLTYTVTGLCGNDKLLTEPKLSYASTPNMYRTGTTKILVSGADAGGNYTIEYVTGKLTVYYPVTQVRVDMSNITLTDKAYDGKALTYTGYADSNYNVDFTYTWLDQYGNRIDAPVNAGTYRLRATVDTYGYSGYAEKTVTIEKAQIKITANDLSAEVGAALPELTYTIRGLAAGDKLKTEPTLSCNAVMSAAGEYAITASGAEVPDMKNYESSITYVEGKLTVAEPETEGDTPSEDANKDEETENSVPVIGPVDDTSADSDIDDDVTPDMGDGDGWQFPWWILLLITAAVIGYILYRKSKEKQ